jgi:uncharacterized membrane protein YkoI
MNRKKLTVGAVVVAMLALGGGTAYAAAHQQEATQQGTTAQEEQQPQYTGSIAAPEEKDQGNEAADANEGEDQGNEAAESKQLQSLARIDQTTAEQAALEAVPGTVKDTELENENGFVVYGVEIAGNDGKTYDVKVDAGNAKVLQQEVEGTDEGNDSEEAN